MKPIKKVNRNDYSNENIRRKVNEIIDRINGEKDEPIRSKTNKKS